MKVFENVDALLGHLNEYVQTKGLDKGEKDKIKNYLQTLLSEDCEKENADSFEMSDWRW